MAVDRKGKSITMTADADSIAAGNYFFIGGLTFQGASLNAGERLRVTDAGGSLIADYLVSAATDNADLWNGREPQYVNGILVEDGPATGTWVLTFFLD
jgi:hypothetical protein